MSHWRQMDTFIADTHGNSHVLPQQSTLRMVLCSRSKEGENENLIVAYEDEKLISLLGYIPTRFIWGEEVVTGAWMAHWMTMKGYRFGIGALLMKRITEMFPVVRARALA